MLSARIEAGDFSSAVYLAQQGTSRTIAGALGWAVREPVRLPATMETIYDLASLTKPLITALLCVQHCEAGQLQLDDQVAMYLKELDREEKRGLSIRQLLAHTSGMPAWRPLYVDTGGEPSRTLEVIAGTPLECRPATRVIYSDLNFILLGLLLEKIDQAPFRTIATQQVIAPLGLKSTFFSPRPDLLDRTAASEVAGNSYEKSLCSERLWSQESLSLDVLRKHIIWGEVHDGNAHFLGGAAGHAGLFSIAAETLILAKQFLPESSSLLNARSCALFRTNMTFSLNEGRSAGWQLAETKDSAAGPSLSPNSFGHAGFTGTSCWVDAARDRIFILLTNRTHSHGFPFTNINQVRRDFHSLAVAALESESAAWSE